MNEKGGGCGGGCSVETIPPEPETRPSFGDWLRNSRWWRAEFRCLSPEFPPICLLSTEQVVAGIARFPCRCERLTYIFGRGTAEGAARTSLDGAGSALGA